MSYFHSSLYSLCKETKRAVKFVVGFQRTILLLRRFLKAKGGLSLLLSADLLIRTVGKFFHPIRYSLPGCGRVCGRAIPKAVYLCKQDIHYIVIYRTSYRSCTPFGYFTLPSSQNSSKGLAKLQVFASHPPLSRLAGSGTVLSIV